MEFPSDDNLQSCRQAKSVFFSVHRDIYICVYICLTMDKSKYFCTMHVLKHESSIPLVYVRLS